MNTLKILTLNIQHAKKCNNSSLGKLSEVIRESNADIIGLQEVDKNRCRSNMQDQAKVLARMLKMFYVFAPTIRSFFSQYGNAVLSRFPILDYHSYHLPSAAENRGLVLTYIKNFIFMNTHLGINQNERKKHVQDILNLSQELKRPLILAGDFNANPTAEEIVLIQTLFQDTALSGNISNTFPTENPKYRIDYIFVSKHWEISHSYVINKKVSDHFPLLSIVRLKTR